MQMRLSKRHGQEHTQKGATDVEGRPEHEPDGDADDTAKVPNITQMPEGYEVVEQQVGRAVGQWVLQVRCQCGKRWFEVEAIEATNCPRCGLLVYVDVAKRGA